MNEPQLLPKRNGHWKAHLSSVLFGQAIMFVFWLCGYIFTQGQKSTSDTQLSKEVGSLQAEVEMMKKEGTNYSHYTLTSIQTMDTTRIDKLELRLNNYEVMVSKVDRMEGEIKHLEEIKTR
jgi:hypothetical protein